MKLDRKKKLKLILKYLFKSPKRLTFIIDYNKEFHNYFIKEHKDYYPLKVADTLDFVKNKSVTIEPFMSDFVGSDFMTIVLLKNLALRFDKCQFLEIGTYYGITTQNMEPYVESGFTMDIKKHDRTYHTGKRIKEIIADSTTFDWTGLGRFDLIYVDGNHHYDAVVSDTRKAFEVLNDGGIIVFDDIVSKDAAYGKRRWLRWDVITGVYDGCPEDKRKHLYLLSNMCNIIYIEDDVKTLTEYGDRLLNIDMFIGESNV